MIRTDSGSNRYVVVVGGMNVDIGGTSFKPLLAGDSNPGRITVAAGGVGRNIAHNLTLLGMDVRLLSACGNDGHGAFLLDSCRRTGINVENVLVCTDMPTSCYLYIAGPAGDMALAVNDMAVCKKITPAYLENNRTLLNSAAAVVLDANLTEDTIQWLADNCDVPLYCDPVSVSKAPKLKNVLGAIHTLKPNRLEAELLSGVKISSPGDAVKAAEELLETGMKRVFISLGADGVCAAEKGECLVLPNPKTDVVNTTGCGDSFMAALVYAGVNTYSLRASAVAGLKAASVTAQSPMAVNPELSEKIFCVKVENIKMNLNPYLDVKPDVAEALASGKPVVALESTIISHGMPYPQNVETALNVERIVRENGAVPATIAIIGGRLKAGLTPEEIEYFGKKGTAIAKASRRDLAMLCARGEDGATTVTTTMIIAHMAGISIFATGGIGGVHRGAETTMDISADLEELAHTPVMVVCAGAKSILDLGLTLEYLETHGVPVLGYQTEELPAFYTRSSGFGVDYRVDTPEELACAFKVQNELKLGGGMLVTNPIPEEYSMPPEIINAAIERALAECNEKGIKGKATTPFLLAKVAEITGGDSLASNIRLVYNNAALAAKTASAYCKMK